VTSTTIKGRGLALHLAQHAKNGEEIDKKIVPFQPSFTLTVRSSLCLNILGTRIEPLIQLTKADHVSKGTRGTTRE
jgi:hypothetical protein